MVTSYPEGTTHYIKMDFTCAYFKKGEGGSLYIYEDMSGDWKEVKDSARSFVETHAKPVGVPRGVYTPPSWISQQRRRAMIPQGATHINRFNPLCKYYKFSGLDWEYWNPVDEKWCPSTQDEETLEPIVNNVAQPHDTVQNPKHYQLLPGVEVYDIRQALAAKATAAGATLDQFSDYDRAVEYLLRMWEKNGVEDAQKAAWYLNKLVEKLNGSGS